MPNTPAQIQAGVSALYALNKVSPQQREQANLILAAVGKTVWLDDENKMDAVTAISGSGPAYVFYLIEALQEAGVKLGLTADEANMLAVQTFKGASLLAAQSADDVVTLRAQVTSKGGTTEQGILALETADIKHIMQTAAKAAADKSKSLGDALSK
jgi:pyrroline-5-carboxylate reductase